MKTTLQKIHRVAHVATLPIHYAVVRIQHPQKRKAVKIAVGVLIMLTGSTLATHPVVFVPHILWDAMSYGLHAYGACPIIKILCAKFDLEHLEEEEEREHKPRKPAKAKMSRRASRISYENN